MANITLNGRTQEFPKEMTISDLLKFLEINPQGTAVALNAAIVPREQHEIHMVQPGDHIEIVRAIGGG